MSNFFLVQLVSKQWFDHGFMIGFLSNCSVSNGLIMVLWLVSKNPSDIDVIKTLPDSGSSRNSGDSQKQPPEMFYKTILKRICEWLLFVTIFHLNLWSGKRFKLLPSSAVFCTCLQVHSYYRISSSLTNEILTTRAIILKNSLSMFVSSTSANNNKNCCFL